MPRLLTMIAIGGWASSWSWFGRGPRRRISSTWSVIATTVSTAPSTGFSGLRLARLLARFDPAIPHGERGGNLVVIDTRTYQAERRY